MELFAQTKPTADVEYLSGAITREAITEKFKNIFGRDPVARTAESPMKVDDGRIPTMISDSLDSEIAKMLQSSAVETSDEASGVLPEIENGTLLYTIKDTEPASIALESVEEYTVLDPASADATAESVSEQEDINVEDGVAYLSPETSTITIGIFADNSIFAEEFQYRLENAGGDQLSPEEKEKVFDELFDELPGGEDTREENLREDLLKVVGLTSALTPESVPEEKQAPGPDAVATPAETPAAPSIEQPTASIKEVVSSLVKEMGFEWPKIAKVLQNDMNLWSNDLVEAEQEYISMASEANGLDAMCMSNGDILEKYSVIVSAKRGSRKLSVKNIIYGNVNNPDIIVTDISNGSLSVVNEEEISLY